MNYRDQTHIFFNNSSLLDFYDIQYDIFIKFILFSHTYLYDKLVKK